MLNLKGLMRVDINDYRQYDSETCCNGGGYSWHHNYTRVCENMWELTESTSGEFCPYCRSWYCAGECRDGMEPMLVTDDELTHIIAEWSDDGDDDDVEVQQSPGCLKIDVWPESEEEV